MTHMLLFVDGSVRRGGRAGIGVVLAAEDGVPVKRFGEPLEHPVASTTEAEYHALLRGLQMALDAGATAVEIYTDSSLLHGHLVLGWACNERLQPLREEAQRLLSRFASWQLHRIPSEQNQLAHCYAETASTQNRRRFFWQQARKRNQKQHTKEAHNMILTVTQPELLEPDVYTVRLDAVEPVQGQFGEQLRWRFTIAGGQHKGAALTAWTNLSTALNGKTLRWAQALLGEPIAPGDAVDTDTLIGKQARAVVETKTAPDGKRYNRITDLLPVKKTQAQPDYGPFEED